MFSRPWQGAQVVLQRHRHEASFQDIEQRHFAKEELLSAVSLCATAVEMTVEDAQRECARTRRVQGRGCKVWHGISRRCILERCRSGSLGQKQQARSSAHKMILRWKLQVHAGAKHTASQRQHGVAFSQCLSRISKRVRRVVWRCKAGATSSKFSVEVTCQLLGFLAADTGILSTVAILRLPRPFACTTTLECHSSPFPRSNPPGLQLDTTADPPRSIRNCPHQFAAFHQAQNSRPRHRIVPSTPPPLPQWHLLPSLQQLQAVTLALHAQIRAASGKCIPACILRHAATRYLKVHGRAAAPRPCPKSPPPSHCYMLSLSPTTPTRCYYGLSGRRPAAC